MLTGIGLLYNLYADRQLGLGLVPQSVYDMQDKFYPTVKEKYGVPLDTRGTYTKGMLTPLQRRPPTDDYSRLGIVRRSDFVPQHSRHVP
jgi:hypothetical protein